MQEAQEEEFQQDFVYVKQDLNNWINKKKDVERGCIGMKGIRTVGPVPRE